MFRGMDYKMCFRLRIIDKEIIKSLLKDRIIKLDGLFSLPWFLEWIARDIFDKEIFYVIFDSNIVSPIILIKKNPLKIVYMPSPPNLIKKVAEEYLCPKLDMIKEISGAINFHVLIVRVHPHDNVSRLKFLLPSKNALLVEDRADLFVDLKRNVSDIFYTFEKRTRYVLRRSLRLNDEEVLRSFAKDPYLEGKIYEENNEKGLEDFSKLLRYQLAKIISEKRGENSKDLLRLQSYYGVENIKKSFAILGREGLLRLFFAQGDTKKPEAAVALFVSKDYLFSPMAYWWLGASTYSAERSGLPTLLQFSIINVLKKEGYERYFLGGIGKDFRQVSSGPALFKRGFSKNFRQGYLLMYARGIPLSKLRLLSSPTIFRFIKHLIRL
jgi:hypothetical protein